jgi:hypothetical protein
MEEADKQSLKDANIASYPAYTAVVVMLSIILLLLIVSIAGYISYQAATVNAAPSGEPAGSFSLAKMMMTGGMIGSLVIILVLIVRLFRLSVKPYNTLIRHSMDSIHEDSASIKKTVSGISLGDLSTKIIPRATRLVQHDFPGLSQLVAKFNEIIDALHGTIQ